MSRIRERFRELKGVGRGGFIPRIIREVAEDVGDVHGKDGPPAGGEFARRYVGGQVVRQNRRHRFLREQPGSGYIRPVIRVRRTQQLRFR